MKKRIKVFQAGKYPQGEFDIDRVNKIFGDVKNADGIYAHTSKWLEKGEKPLNIGEFSNFTIENGVVMADCEFNEKGESYYNDGVIRGVSVEIQGDSLGKIALLPIGVKPAVTGAEFEEQEGAYLDFEEFEEEKGGKVMDLTAILEAIKTMSLDDRTAIINAVFGSLTNDEKDGIRQLYWADFEKKEPVKVKTEAEIRAEITKEFELKTKGEQLKNAMKTKIIPALQPIVEFAINKALTDVETVEFEENGEKKNISYFEKIEKDINSLPNAANFKSNLIDFEFEEPEENIIEKTRKETEKLLGGKK